MKKGIEMLFNPSVFIVKNEYHITIITKEPSQVYVKIGNRFYYEDNSGIIPILDNVHKLIIKQSILDKAGKYSIYVRKMIEKSCYFPKIDIEKCAVLASEDDFKGSIMISLGGRPHISYKLKDKENVLEMCEKILARYSEFTKN